MFRHKKKVFSFKLHCAHKDVCTPFIRYVTAFLVLHTVKFFLKSFVLSILFMFRYRVSNHFWRIEYVLSLIQNCTVWKFCVVESFRYLYYISIDEWLLCYVPCCRSRTNTRAYYIHAYKNNMAK